MRQSVVNSLDLKRTLAEIDKMQAETRKLLAETAKYMSEQKLTDKRSKWHEITIIIALMAATVTVTKLFL